MIGLESGADCTVGCFVLNFPSNFDLQLRSNSIFNVYTFILVQEAQTHEKETALIHFV